MRYGSVCSGIEAATVAWAPLGWHAAFFAEIDAFPCALLAHRYQGIANLGDVNAFRSWPDADIDVLVGGTPCQSFSVAGLRAGLSDPRGNLMLTYLAIAERYRPRWLVWENVPGVLSADAGTAFGTLLGFLAKLGYGFAYRILDAQYFGLAQRRERVFVIGCLGDWRAAAAVLLERSSLRGDPAPCRKAIQTAPTIPSRRSAGGGLGTEFDCDGGVVPSHEVAQALRARAHASHREDSESYVAGTLSAEDGNIRPEAAWTNRLAFGGSNTSGPIDVATAVTAHGGVGHIDFDTETFVTHTLDANSAGRISEDGTGRGTPLVSALNGADAGATSDMRQCVAFTCKDYGGDAGELATTMRAMDFSDSHANAGGQIAVAFTRRSLGTDADEVAPALDPADFSHNHANAGGQIAVAFVKNQRAQVREMDICGSLAADPGMKRQTYALQEITDPVAANQARTYTREGSHKFRMSNVALCVTPERYTHDYCHDSVYSKEGLSPALNVSQAHKFRTEARVRRLTPRECERLQGFPDDYTLIQYRGKPARDGPRYKALGNSMAVPVMRWIAERIQAVEGVREK